MPLAASAAERVFIELGNRPRAAVRVWVVLVLDHRCDGASAAITTDCPQDLTNAGAAGPSATAQNWRAPPRLLARLALVLRCRDRGAHARFLEIAAVAATLVSCSPLTARPNRQRSRAGSRRRPRSSARKLTAQPTTDWITNGGNVFNQRYSPLTLLDRDNVKDLKALWRTGMGSGANPNNSGQAQILHYEGVLFVINGANDVFALDVDTGAILWTYRGNPDPRAGVPMGRSSRGVAMGEGKIFVAQIDARLVALDQRTGEVVWSPRPIAGRTASASRARRCTTTASSSPASRAARWRAAAASRRSARGTASSRGRSTRCRAPASSATTRGRRTATRGSSAARPCGRRRPSTPSSSSSTSRPATPGPICTAACAPATTCSASRSSRSTRRRGKYRWHFQQVHHDIWDYDSPNPVVLFDAQSTAGCAKASSKCRRRAGRTSSIAKPASR